VINSEYETLNKYHSLSIANPNLFWEDRAKLIEWFDFPKKFLINQNHHSAHGFQMGLQIYALMR
jgi:hypothetical protein